MRRFARAALLAIVMLGSALKPAFAQLAGGGNNPIPPVVTRGGAITPLGGFVIGSVACAAISPMIGTVVLGRELTYSEVYHTGSSHQGSKRRAALGGRARHRRAGLKLKAAISTFRRQAKHASWPTRC
jgi:hypothetical protein